MNISSANINQSAKTMFGPQIVMTHPADYIVEDKKIRKHGLYHLIYEVTEHPEWFPENIVTSVNELSSLQKKLNSKVRIISDLKKIREVIDNSSKPKLLEKELGKKGVEIFISEKKLSDEIKPLLTERKELFAQIKKDYSPWFKEKQETLSIIDKQSRYWLTLVNVSGYIEYLNKN
ncbi:MAG: hypothetical protein ABIH00_11945 [Armatimonadota bacterium]